MALNIGNVELLKDKVYNALKSEIIFGHYSPGMQINIIEIANEMNISTAPVREALNMLQKDGLVSLLPHKKPIVTEVDGTDWAVSMELRKMLEPYVAKISCKKIPQDAIDYVREKLNNTLKTQDITVYMDSDMELHELLYKYSESPLLNEILSTLKTYTTRIRYSVERSLEDDPDNLTAIISESTEEHLEIVDAIDARDEDMVEEKVRMHIENYIRRNANSDIKSIA